MGAPKLLKGMWFGVKVTGALIIGAPFCVAGIALCITIIGIPIGVPLFLLGGWPLQKVVQHAHVKLMDTHERKGIHPEGAKPPWNAEDDLFLVSNGIDPNDDYPY